MIGPTFPPLVSREVPRLLCVDEFDSFSRANACDSVADSLCYLSRRAPPHRPEWKGKKHFTGENSGHFDVMRSISKDGKASNAPHRGCYGDDLRRYTNIINVWYSLYDNTRCGRIYEAV